MIKNKLYTKYLDEISSLKSELNNTLDELAPETMEEEEIYQALWKAAEALSEAKHSIAHFSKDVREGVLVESIYGKFEIQYENGETSYPLSCGNSIEIYLDEEGWNAGRVEHNGQYYFYGPGKPPLYEGMKARIRV